MAMQSAQVTPKAFSADLVPALEKIEVKSVGDRWHFFMHPRFVPKNLIVRLNLKSDILGPVETNKILARLAYQSKTPEGGKLVTGMPLGTLSKKETLRSTDLSVEAYSILKMVMDHEIKNPPTQTIR